MAQRRFEHRINALSDLDWAWWPLLALRPRREQAISEARLLLIALLFGGFCALTGLLLLYLLLGELPRDAGTAVATACLAVFYLALRFTLFLCWNRRARRLAAAAAQPD